MPPQLATLICLGLIGYLFWLDRKPDDGVSKAAWIPFLWMFFASSRFASQWLALGPPSQMSAHAFSEGSALDRNVFTALVLAGIWVLSRRGLNLTEFASRNAWICLFFLFAAISVVWSDDPLVSLKRLVKGIGNLIMALVILTERRPYEALGLILRRLGFVLIPLSVLFVRYYPELGRGYHMGQPFFTGVAFSKNALGQLCLIVAVYLCWELMLRKWRPSVLPRHPLIYLIMLPMTGWLLYRADCATCSGLMVMALACLVAFRSSALARQPRLIVALGMAVIALVASLEYMLGIKDRIIRLLGREPDLTTRVPIWEALLKLAPDPWIGAGYEIFWSGERLQRIWSILGDEDDSGGIIQAHNGYIETYLNLGIIGVALLVIGIVSGTLKVIDRLESDYANAALGAIIIFMVVLYNYTEAAYKPLHNLFVLLLFVIVRISIRPRLRSSTRSKNLAVKFDNR